MVRAPRSRGFTLVEAMVSVAIAGILMAGVMGSFSASRQARQDARHEWVAFTLAQAQLEMLASAPANHASLDDDTPDGVVIPGSLEDGQCATGADGSLAADMHVDELGQPRTDGKYTLCWKVTGGNPFGSLKNIRVVVGYPSATGEGHVLLQTIR